MPNREHLFDDLADAVLDGAAVDWAAAESSAGAAAQPFVRDLRLVASVAQVYRDVLPIATPAHWGHLRLLERIGYGAFGEVFRAFDTRLDREVALKLLPASPSSDQQAASSVIQEGRLLAKVRHPNVVTIHGAEQIGDRVGLWMEFVRGQTLEQLLQRGTVFRSDEVISIGVEVCRAVSAVHAAGLLHRDIKAHNVMRAEDGRVLLMDFGTGRELDDESPADVAGTPLYLAPELLRGAPATVQTDVYSLGVLLYRLVSGSYPVRGGSVRELRAAHERDERVPARAAHPNVETGLARLIDQAIDPRPEWRPQTADALGAGLLTLQRRARMKPLLYATAAVMTLAIVGVTAWALRTRQAPSSASPETLAAAAPGSAPAASQPSSAVLTVPKPAVVRDPVRPQGLRPSIQVLPITNTSGRITDGWLSAALAEMLLREFRGSESFRWIPGAVPLAKAQLGTALATQSSLFIRPTVAAEIVVSGEYAVSGQSSGPPSGLRLTLRLDDKTSGRPATTLTEADTMTDLIGLVSRIGTQARAALGVSALTESQAKAIAASQPANADAARAYAEGLSKPAPEWVESMEQAIAADPRFAPAHAALAEGWMFRKDPAKAKAAAARAVELAVDLPFEERMLIEIRASVASGVGGTGPPDVIASARQQAVEAREETFRQLYARNPDTLLYGLETARAQERTRQFESGLATVEVISRLPGASEDVVLLQLEARLARSTRDYGRAQRALEKAAAVATAVGDQVLSRTIHSQQAWVAIDVGEPAKALSLAQAALQSGENPDRVNEILGVAYRALGNVARAKAIYEQRSAGAKDRGNRYNETSHRFVLGTVLSDHGNLSEARTMFEQLIRDGETYDAWPNRGPTVLALGAVLYRQGHLSDALSQMEGVFSENGWRPHRVARLLFEQGEVLRARELATRSIQIGRGIEPMPQEEIASALTVLARTLLVMGETTAARQAIDDAAPLARTTGSAQYQALGLARYSAFDLAIVRALVALDEGRWSDGRSAAQQAIALARGDFRPDDEAAGEGVLGLAWLGEGNLVKAQQAITRVEQRLKVTEDRLLHLSGGIAAARVQAASNLPASIALARQRLDALSREADGLGAVAIAFEARLALGQIEIKAGDVATGRARLTTLGREATAKGFVSVARKAAAAAK